MLRTALIASALSVCTASGASAALNEFSVADGYQSPFSTRVWTYNSLWTFEGGALGNNYVAQHGYGSGFATTEPYALVIRNDAPAGNYRFNYQFEPVDVAGFTPSNMSSARVTISFDALTSVASSTPSGQTMATMAFGGTRANPAVTLGFSDGDYLMYSDGSNTLTEYTGYAMGAGSWDRINLTMDFSSFTYDLSIQQMTGNPLNASNTFTPINTFAIVTGQPFATNTTDLSRLWFETFTDSDTGGGWHKWFLDNFDSRNVPGPSTGALLALAGLVGASRRRIR